MVQNKSFALQATAPQLPGKFWVPAQWYLEKSRCFEIWWVELLGQAGNVQYSLGGFWHDGIFHGFFNSQKEVLELLNIYLASSNFESNESNLAISTIPSKIHVHTATMVSGPGPKPTCSRPLTTSTQLVGSWEWPTTAAAGRAISARGSRATVASVAANSTTTASLEGK